MKDWTLASYDWYYILLNIFIGIIVSSNNFHSCFTGFSLIYKFMLPAVCALEILWSFVGFSTCTVSELYHVLYACSFMADWHSLPYTHKYKENQHFWNFCKSEENLSFSLAYINFYILLTLIKRLLDQANCV